MNCSFQPDLSISSEAINPEDSPVCPLPFTGLDAWEVRMGRQSLEPNNDGQRWEREELGNSVYSLMDQWHLHHLGIWPKSQPSHRLSRLNYMAWIKHKELIENSLGFWVCSWLVRRRSPLFFFAHPSFQPPLAILPSEVLASSEVSKCWFLWLLCVTICPVSVVGKAIADLLPRRPGWGCYTPHVRLCYEYLVSNEKCGTLHFFLSSLRVPAS